MSNFTDALESEGKSDLIPPVDDLYAPLIGEWDFEWVDRLGTTDERRVKGEWIFTRILDGTAVQDIFICPSREERKKNPQPDAEYGTTIRVYNPESRLWDVFYGCLGGSTRLEGMREDGMIVQTEVEEGGEGKQRWVFSHITAHSFQWTRWDRLEEDDWTEVARVYAVRR